MNEWLWYGFKVLLLISAWIFGLGVYWAIFSHGGEDDRNDF